LTIQGQQLAAKALGRLFNTLFILLETTSKNNPLTLAAFGQVSCSRWLGGFNLVVSPSTN
jgi:hypothetical protein